MRKSQLLSIVFLLGLCSLTQAQGKKPSPYAAMAPLDQYLIHDAQQEIDLARSAAPPSISAAAEVLVLGEHGYEVALKGTNGFVCLVERSWAAGFNDPEFWNPRLRAPNCFNPPAVRSVLPQYLRRTEWALTGSGGPQLIEKARAAMTSGRFTPPEAGSFSFMLSKRGYLGDAAGGPWFPHVMFFVAHGQASAWAAGLDASPILGADGNPFEPTVLYIPVGHWSDGSPAPGASGGHQHQGSVSR